ncbi:MAG: leucine-rich repeat domain-containing protein, partial [Clostridia bacterium]|nr:leucine-rich repeat domain-containing protein [Clostridia bacterium]
MAQLDNEDKITASPQNGRNKKIALIVLAAILVVAIVATAVALLVRADFSPSLKEIDGYVLSISRGNVTIVKYTGTDKEVEINDKLDGKRVVGIAEEAFKDNKTVTTLKIKSNAASFEIGAQAFYNMTNLAEVVLPDNVKSISSQAFSGCGNLTSLTMGNAVEYIGNYAFSECGKLNKIYISESSGGNGTKTGIYDITMPSSLKTIDSYAFYKAITSSSTSIQLNSQLKTIGSNAFDGASRLTYVDYIGSECSLDSIGSYAFYGCSYLRYNPRGNTSGTDITLVGAQNMLACSLKSESLVSIGAHAFENNTYASSKVTLRIFDSLESIGEYAFANNASGQNIEFCGSNPDLGNAAFYNCASVKSVKYLTQNTDNGEYSVESKETSL